MSGATTARDAAIHAVQACVPDRDLLPVGVERIETRGLAGRGELTLRAQERSREPGGFVYDLEIQARDGEIVERWSGREWELRQHRTEAFDRLTAARRAGDADEASLSWGQDAGLIHDIIPAGDIVRRVVDEAEAIIAGLVE